MGNSYSVLPAYWCTENWALIVATEHVSGSLSERARRFVPCEPAGFSFVYAASKWLIPNSPFICYHLRKLTAFCWTAGPTKLGFTGSGRMLLSRPRIKLVGRLLVQWIVPRYIACLSTCKLIGSVPLLLEFDHIVLQYTRILTRWLHKTGRPK